LLLVLRRRDHNFAEISWIAGPKARGVMLKTQAAEVLGNRRLIWQPVLNQDAFEDAIEDFIGSGAHIQFVGHATEKRLVEEPGFRIGNEGNLYLGRRLKRHAIAQKQMIDLTIQREKTSVQQFAGGHTLPPQIVD